MSATQKFDNTMQLFIIAFSGKVLKKKKKSGTRKEAQGEVTGFLSDRFSELPTTVNLNNRLENRKNAKWKPKHNSFF